MLYHHGAQDYNVAASAAAAEARSKFEAEIERGKARTLAVIEQVQTQVPTDRIVAAKKLEFITLGNGIKVRFPDTDRTEEGFHRHAIGQAAARADIPLSFIDRLMEKGQWGAELVAENLNRIYHNGNGARYLTRSVKNEVRGFLSDSYRRLDSRPIVDQFIQAVATFGAVPLDGYALETKIAVKAVLPYVFEPVPHEVMIFGVALENSDFGRGALSLRTFVERLWCTNRAISTEDLRKIHLGARLGEDLQLSQRTYDLDTQTMASAAQDIVQDRPQERDGVPEEESPQGRSRCCCGGFQLSRSRDASSGLNHMADVERDFVDCEYEGRGRGPQAGSDESCWRDARRQNRPGH